MEEKKFFDYCRAHNVLGCIDDSNIKVIDANNTIQIIATVWMDGRMAGCSSAFADCSKTVDAAALDNVRLKARAHALENAGFGSAVDGTTPPNTLYTPTYTPTYTPAPIPIPAAPVAPPHIFNPAPNPAPAPVAVAEPVHPVASPIPPQPQTYSAPYPAMPATQMPVQQEKERVLSVDEVADEMAKTMTFEEAMAFVIDRGKHSGKTMAELAGSDRNSIRFFAEKCNSAKYERIIAASRVITRQWDAN